MKCLSVRQPWAALIIAGTKTVENRAWRPGGGYRGDILIHASAVPDRAAFPRARAAGLDSEALRYGGIIGVVRLIDVVRDSDSEWAQPGAWHWILADARPLPFIESRGRLGLYERRLPAEVLAEVPD